MWVGKACGAVRVVGVGVAVGEHAPDRASPRIQGKKLEDLRTWPEDLPDLELS